jgi:imidazole glycerol phosphate synthase glutamine amidotransferase subunit
VTAREVVVVATGTANTASVLAGLRRAGGVPRLSEDPSEVKDAARVVLPGVGAFAAAKSRLDGLGLTGPLRERLSAGRPTLCVCLGLQLLAEGSEESPDVSGFGVVAGTVRRFAAGLRVPHMGWNQVTPQGEARFLTAGHAYFANSYRLETPPPGWAWAASDHGGPFVAAVERAGVLACQFHPELSGAWGQALLTRWVTTSEEAACSPSA